MPEILASIGIQNGKPCYNLRSDQLIVVDLLNKIPAREGGSLQIGGLPTKFPNAEEGRCTPQLHQAILRFQQAHLKELQFADGHVDPGLHTIRLLNRLASVERSMVELSQSFIFNVLDLRGFAHGPLGVITAINDVSCQMASYRFGPRSFWEPLLHLTQGVRNGATTLTTSEPVSTEAFSGPVTFLKIYDADGLFNVKSVVFNSNLTVNLSSGRTSRITFQVVGDPKFVPGGYSSGEMHLVDSSEASAAGLEFRVREHRLGL